MSASPPDSSFLDRALQLAAENVARGGGPFGALVVSPTGVVVEGVNGVTRGNDPTAHAEIEAIRSACRQAETFSLEGWVLYSSCEPCPMCLSACLWARLSGVYYVATRDDAAAGGFDDREFYELLEHPGEHWPLPVLHIERPGSTRPFEQWRENQDATPY